MRIGTVVGNIWATRKEEGLQGLKLLIIQPKKTNGQLADEQIVAADRIGAGVGDDVILTMGSAAVRSFSKEVICPIDAIVVGIIDGSDE
ncbi:EutN/CcmL family microcompartment protein [Lysinibacillus macroides]|uniref:Ethanolamine utilization protein EutN n=1 Tax=Lysinibacillus macroides TaxID=33935 RepID=A0A0M9DFS5_9BACI|nr:EutN/CcmL family microcompartment protein [Lysinibacillus macroides]KOY80588.1 ethanolamine utilization protein EutN [Lysinibacillus macroides]QPR69724.1 EutN/CcmL family microcompartment protein [Lysinibacillus macroides]